jgi:predicted nucleic acid-binding protein
VTFSTGQGAIVVDASVAVRFVEADATWLALWSSWIESGAMILAPAHFGHELANALLRGTDAGPERAEAMLDAVFRAGFETADRGLAGLVRSIGLADRHRLTVYDAAYLDLALDVDGQLATLDRALARAATAEGIEVLG